MKLLLLPGIYLEDKASKSNNITVFFTVVVFRFTRHVLRFVELEEWEWKREEVVINVTQQLK